MDIAAVRAGLRTLLETVDGLRASNDTDTVLIPNGGGWAMIAPAPNFADVVTLDGAADLRFNIIVLVSKAAEARVPQQLLDGYAVTLPDLVDTDATADWDYCVPDSPTDYGDYTIGAGDGAQVYLGFTLPVTIGVS